MDSIETSDEYENDSLEVDSADDELDKIEIPESPLTPKVDNDLSNNLESKTNNGSNVCLGQNQRKNAIDFVMAKNLFSKNKPSSSSKSYESLPSGIVVFDKKGKTLDFRDHIKTKNNTNQNKVFGQMKFKDFKEAKKKLETEKNAKIEKSDLNLCDTQHNYTTTVSQKVKNLKRSLSIILKSIEELEKKNVDNHDNFVKKRHSIFPPPKNALAEDSVEIDNKNEIILDSLENSPTQIDESRIDVSDMYEKKNFIKSRMSMCANEFNPVIADESIYKERDGNKNNLFDTNLDSLENFSTRVDEDHQKDLENDKPNSSSGDYSMMYNEPTRTRITEKQDFYNQHNDSNVKLKIYKVRKENDHHSKINNITAIRNVQYENLFRSLCQNCRNYYSTRKLSVEDLQRLTDRCSKHRGYRSAYRSPPRFWEIDFPQTSDSIELKERSQEKNKFKNDSTGYFKSQKK